MMQPQTTIGTSEHTDAVGITFLRIGTGSAYAPVTYNVATHRTSNLTRTETGRQQPLLFQGSSARTEILSLHVVISNLRQQQLE